MLWDDVVVEDGALLKECVVADGVVVPADTSWHGVTLRVPTASWRPASESSRGLPCARSIRVPEGFRPIHLHGH